LDILILFLSYNIN